MIKKIFGSIKGAFSRKKQSNSIIITTPTAQVQEVDEPIQVDTASLQKAIAGHVKGIPGIISQAMNAGLGIGNTEHLIEGIITDTISDLAKVVNLWQKNAAQKLQTFRQTIETEIPKWEPRRVIDRFVREIENQGNVLKESLKSVYEEKILRGLDANRLRDDIIKSAAEKRVLVIRLLGDEKGELKMMNLRLFTVLVIALFGIITALEALLGMPIFRFESNSDFAYAMSLAFAWLLGGFTIISSHHMNRVIAGNQAKANYRHTYDEEHLPKDSEGKVIKPMQIKLMDKILAFGGTAVLVLIAIVLLAWRVITSFGMEQDGGFGFMSAFLLLAVVALMYAVDLVLGPKFALNEYKKYNSFVTRETEIKAEIKALTDDTATATQVQNLLRRYNSEVKRIEEQIHAEAAWIKGERDHFCDQVIEIERQLSLADGFRATDFMAINDSLQREPYAMEAATVQSLLKNPRWKQELEQQLLPVQIDSGLIDRLRAFEPVYTLPEDKQIKNFTLLIGEAEKEARAKVKKQLAEQNNGSNTGTNGGIIPLVLS